MTSTTLPPLPGQFRTITFLVEDRSSAKWFCQELMKTTSHVESPLLICGLWKLSEPRFSFCTELSQWSGQISRTLSIVVKRRQPIIVIIALENALRLTWGLTLYETEGVINQWLLTLIHHSLTQQDQTAIVCGWDWHRQLSQSWRLTFCIVIRHKRRCLKLNSFTLGNRNTAIFRYCLISVLIHAQLFYDFLQMITVIPNLFWPVTSETF